jgi:hypothetical protein
LFDPFKDRVRLGFPKDADRLKSTGVQKVLLMAIDYSDAPTKEDATEALKFAFDTDDINESYDCWWCVGAPWRDDVLMLVRKETPLTVMVAGSFCWYMFTV